MERGRSDIIGTEELDRLKSDPSVLKIYGQYVQGLERAGSLYTGLCPLHSDSHPSLSIYPDMRWTCFSGPGCGSGNIFQLIERLDGVSFQEAVEKVRREVGEDTWSRDKQRVETIFKPVAEKKNYKTIPLSAWAKAETALFESTKARAWLLKERGITYETAKRRHVGYVQNIGQLAGEAGSDIADKGWLALPSVDGDIIRLIKFRSLERKKPGGFARQTGMETVLFNTNSLDPFEPIYLTSGEFDAMVLEQAGFRAVSLASDTHKPTPEQKDQLMSASAVFLAGDTDAVGSGTMDKLWKELGSRSYKLVWPDVKDANECFLKTCGGDQAKFVQLMDELTRKAKSQPMPSVFSLQEAMLNGDEGQLSERSDRLRFSWPSVDQMLVILPGHVFGMGSTNTGMGKTMWTVQASLHNARKYGRVVLNFQAEMDPSEIGDLVAAQMLRVDRNFLTKEDRVKAANMLADEGVRYFIGRDPNITELKDALDLLEAAIRRLSPNIAILDHFHFFGAGENETKGEKEAMTRIKQMAELYKVIFINIGQPRKPSSASKGKRIHISDFKGSGAWGDTANSVIVIHRDLNKAEEDSTAKGPYEDKCLVQVLKGRSLGRGASSSFLTCFGEFGSFEEVTSNYEEVPV